MDHISVCLDHSMNIINCTSFWQIITIEKYEICELFVKDKGSFGWVVLSNYQELKTAIVTTAFIQHSIIINVTHKIQKCRKVRNKSGTC